MQPSAKVPRLVSLAAFARELGVTPRAVRKWRDRGYLVLQEGKVDRAASLERLAELKADPVGLQAAGARLAGSEASSAYARARAERMTWEARMARLRYLNRAGELCARVDVDRERREVTARLREALGALPGRIARRLAGVVTAEVVELVERQVAAGVQEGLEELAAGLPQARTETAGALGWGGLAPPRSAAAGRSSRAAPPRSEQTKARERGLSAPLVGPIGALYVAGIARGATRDCGIWPSPRPRALVIVNADAMKRARPQVPHLGGCPGPGGEQRRLDGP